MSGCLDSSIVPPRIDSWARFQSFLPFVIFDPAFRSVSLFAAKRSGLSSYNLSTSSNAKWLFPEN